MNNINLSLNPINNDNNVDKYVLHAIYSFVCAHHDVELTFEDWLRKNDFLYENDKGR